MTAMSIYPRSISAAVMCLALSAPAFADPTPKGEAEYLVPPGGGAFDVPIHEGAVVILSFPGEKLSSSAIASSPNFEVKAWDAEGVAVRATGKATVSTLAIGTVSGAIKVNITLHVVPQHDDALTLVRFKASTLEDAFAARVKAEVARETAPIKAQLAQTKDAVDRLVREQSERLMADRLVKRME